MAVNKVDVNGVTVLDLTQDSVTPATLKKGETAHDASGAAIVGEMESSAPSLQSKSVAYTSNGTATITPDEGYDGLNSVDVTVDVSSGGGVETCTVTFSSNIPENDATWAYSKIFLTVFENNEITTKTISDVSNITVSNVVLNSIGMVIYVSTPKSISTTNTTTLNTVGVYMGFTFTGNVSIYSTMSGGGGGGAN